MEASLLLLIEDPKAGISPDDFLFPGGDGLFIADEGKPR